MTLASICAITGCPQSRPVREAQADDQGVVRATRPLPFDRAESKPHALGMIELRRLALAADRQHYRDLSSGYVVWGCLRDPRRVND